MKTYTIDETTHCIVPKEPTEEMVSAAYARRREMDYKKTEREVLRVMLEGAFAAAPDYPADDPTCLMDADNWAELHRLREAVKGPDGYATWQDAAVAERIRRVKAEQQVTQPVQGLSTPRGWALERIAVDRVRVVFDGSGAIISNSGNDVPAVAGLMLYELASAILAASTTQPELSDGTMTNDRAAHFMRRFKHEEKLLGPNEQAAVDHVIRMLESKPEALTEAQEREAVLACELIDTFLKNNLDSPDYKEYSDALSLLWQAGAKLAKGGA